MPARSLLLRRQWPETYCVLPLLVAFAHFSTLSAVPVQMYGTIQYGLVNILEHYLISGCYESALFLYWCCCWVRFEIPGCLYNILIQKMGNRVEHSTCCQTHGALFGTADTPFYESMSLCELSGCLPFSNWVAICCLQCRALQRHIKNAGQLCAASSSMTNAWSCSGP